MPKNKFVIVVIVVTIAYSLIYLALSAMGDYQVVGVSLFKGQAQWQPKTLHMERYKKLNGEIEMTANVGGYVFMPLILIDRATVHKNKNLAKHVLDEFKRSIDE